MDAKALQEAIAHLTATLAQTQKEYNEAECEKTCKYEAYRKVQEELKEVEQALAHQNDEIVGNQTKRRLELRVRIIKR